MVHAGRQWGTYGSKNVVHAAPTMWYMLMEYSDSSLNLNLIIPFKDKKGFKKAMLLRRLKEFEMQLHQRAKEVKENFELQVRGVNRGLAIADRTDNDIKKYYWRRTGRNTKRHFCRLCNEELSAYLYQQFDRREFIALKEAEAEIIYINANLKVLKTMQATLKTADEEASQLLHLQSPQ